MKGRHSVDNKSVVEIRSLAQQDSGSLECSVEGDLPSGTLVLWCACSVERILPSGTLVL